MNQRLHGLPAHAERRDEPADPREARFAQRIVARLNEQVEASVPHDVGERLRFARLMALQHARAARPAAQAAASRPTPLFAPSAAVARAFAGDGRAPAPREPSAWWVRLATALPLAALLGGLALIQQQHVSEQIAAAAEIDADLLTDSVPPAAYNDPGFLEFLKTSQD